MFEEEDEEDEMLEENVPISTLVYVDHKRTLL